MGQVPCGPLGDDRPFRRVTRQRRDKVESSVVRRGAAAVRAQRQENRPLGDQAGPSDGTYSGSPISAV